LVGLTLPMAVTREPQGESAPQDRDRPSLRAALGRPGIRLGIVVVLLSQAGLRLAHGMTAPLLIDRGFDLALLGAIAGVGGSAASIATTFAVAAGLRRWPAPRLLGPALMLQCLLFVGLVAVSLAAQPPLPVLAVL